MEQGQSVPAFVRQPVFGHPVKVPAASGEARGAHLVVFTGHLVSQRARKLLQAMQARVREADSKGVTLVAITSASEDLASDYVPRYHVLFPLIVDPDGVLHQEWGVPRVDGVRRWTRALAGGSPDGWMEALTLGLGREAVDPWCPAAFLVSPEGALVASQVEAGSEKVSLDDLLARASKTA